MTERYPRAESRRQSSARAPARRERHGENLHLIDTFPVRARWTAPPRPAYRAQSYRLVNILPFSLLSRKPVTGVRMPEDAALARRIAGKDEGAFVVLMQRHNRMLYRTARSILGDEREAEDAVQEAYLLAYRTIEQYRGEAKLSTWLVRIVANEAIGRLRKRNRGAALAARLDADGTPDCAPPESPEQGAQRAEARSALQANIDALPVALRTVFVLRALEEMSVEEVAAALSIPQVTVRTRFFRAKRLLRLALAKDVETPFSGAFPFGGQRCANLAHRVLILLAERPSSL
jgi:RNA polymerase sigma-70 factor (ECF subfamily)